MTMLSQITAAGGANAATYVEDVFSTYVYTGNGSTKAITNNIDLSTNGGLVWSKQRQGTTSHYWIDTVRGNTKTLTSNNALAQATPTYPYINSFDTTGFTLSQYAPFNSTNDLEVSWTFRKQPKFFDVVSYSGDGTTNRQISHSLNSVPGFMLVKSLTTNRTWNVYHTSLGNAQSASLETNTAAASTTIWNSTTPTSTNFTVQGDANLSGNTYIAYLFANDAGGFGLNGTDNVISCGYGTASSGSSPIDVTLGYEPQWILLKNATAGGDWWIFDTMRGIGSFSTAQTLFADTSAVEATSGDFTYPLNITSTGFSLNAGYLTWGSSSDKFIYVAIRRGPMKVPTDGTKVFSTISSSASSGTQLTTNFPIDSQIIGFAPGGVTFSQTVNDRLRKVSTTLTASGNVFGTASSATEGALGDATYDWSNAGFRFPPYFSAQSSVFWSFSRAPGFFDQVCYTGTGTATTITHGLKAIPELILVKGRDIGTNWNVYSAALGATKRLVLDATVAAQTNSVYWNDTAPTSSVFSVGTGTNTNGSGNRYSAYLFATCAGVSKVGSYTGTGTTLQINCGFTAGARFVMIKRTDSTGAWYVWDSARGIIAGNDPYLLLNTTDPEVTSTDYVDTYAAGFELSSTAPAALNASGGTYIFLAIA